MDSAVKPPPLFAEPYQLPSEPLLALPTTSNLIRARDDGSGGSVRIPTIRLPRSLSRGTPAWDTQ